MPKRRQRAILSYEQSFCLDLNSYWNHSTGAEHSVCCFTDYTKLYVCAHRVFLLHDLRQDLLCYCPRFPGDGLLLWTGLQNQLAELGEQADPAGMVSTAPRSHGTENLFVPGKMCIYPKSTVFSPGLRRRECVLCIDFCCWMVILSSLTSDTPCARRVSYGKCFKTRREAVLQLTDCCYVGKWKKRD